MLLPAVRRLSLAVLLACGCGGASTGALHITGGDNPVELTPAALTELPPATVAYAGRTYTGVRLRDVLGHAGISIDQPVTAAGLDEIIKELPPAILRRDDAIVAYAVDDALLRGDEGPLRLVVADAPGLSITRLVRLTVGAAAGPAAAGTAAR
jgi:DMSO/TMAO reductase YedYZ molybdopterin-dependent catalytic subunit